MFKDILIGKVKLYPRLLQQRLSRELLISVRAWVNPHSRKAHGSRLRCYESNPESIQLRLHMVSTIAPAIIASQS